MDSAQRNKLRNTYFEDFGISEFTLDEIGIHLIEDFSPDIQTLPYNAIEYKYRFNNAAANFGSKYIDLQHPKKYVLSATFDKALFNYPNFKKAETLIITKTEIDVLTWHECGIENVGAIPPNPLKPISVINDIPEYDFTYLNNCKKGLENKTKIYIDLGTAKISELMREELARRLGKTKCYVIKLPEEFASVNDILLNCGKEKTTEILKKCIECAEPYPIVGIEYAADSLTDLLDIYDNGFPNGAKIPEWPEFSNHLTFFSRMFVLITGIASDGKSTLLDNLLVLLMRNTNWKIGIFSPEYSKTSIHLMKLIRIINQASFLPKHHNRMSRETVIETSNYLNKMMFWMRPKYKESTLDNLLEMAKNLVLQYGIKILVFDPVVSIAGFYNGTVEQLMENLNKLREFEREYDILLFLVVHPTKLPRVKPGSMITPAPRLDDVAGGANWQNVIDVGLVFYQVVDEKTGKATPFLYFKKIREDHVGHKGAIQLKFDPITQILTEDIQPIEIQVPRAVKQYVNPTAYMDKENRTIKKDNKINFSAEEDNSVPFYKE